MGAVLVFLQSQEDILPKPTLAALSAAREIAAVHKHDKLIGLVLGPKAKAAAALAATFGLAEVCYSEAAVFSSFRAAVYAQAITALANEVSAAVVVGVASSHGRDVLPRVAASIEAAQASEILGVNADGSYRRPMYAGDVFADVSLTTSRSVISVRATAFGPATPQAGAAAVREVNFSIDQTNAGEVISLETSGGDRPDLNEASVVVSGGRALQSSENFEKYIFPLADAFGAAVGASRAAVDSGYAPNDWQVGQTGKVVAPSLYVAVGISGAIQHLAGMKDSKTIVAINKDPDAPIYEVADFGLVADLYQAVPELTEKVRKARGL